MPPDNTGKPDNQDVQDVQDVQETGAEQEAPESLTDVMSKRLSELRADDTENDQQEPAADDEGDIQGNTDSDDGDIEPEQLEGEDFSDEPDDGTGEEDTAKAEGEADQGPDDDQALQDRDLTPEEQEQADDQLAQNMKAKTAERFNHFRDEAKRLQQQLDQNVQAVTPLIDRINDAGANADQLGALLGLAKAFNTGDFSTISRQNWTQIQRMVGDVALGIGAPQATQQVQLPPDLQKAVDDMRIDENYAREIAATRMREQQRQQYAAQQQQRNQATSQGEARRQRAAQALEQWEAQHANDAGFNERVNLMMQHAPEVFSQMQPEHWVTEFDRQYKLLQGRDREFESQLQQQERERAKNRQQPLRPSGASGHGKGKKVEHKTLQDRLAYDLAQMRE